MKKVDYQDWKRRKREVFLKLIDIENKFEGRVPGRRPRDPEKEKILLQLDKARRARYIETGKIEILGPQRMKWHVNFKKG
ncbi:MAG: hypothetical protein ABFD83_11645 [Armatimonadota bacterium]